MPNFPLSPDFPDSVQSLLQDALATGPRIDSQVVAQILDIMQIEIGTLMIQLLPTAASYARVPISDYHVGAVALGAPPGSLYLGSNMEFGGQALSFCVHGEQSATNHAWLNGETGLQALAINAAPCGYCRQFLYEITTATSGFNILLKANTDPNDYSYTSQPLTTYLPDAFGPGDLGIKDRLMQPQNHGLNIGTSDPLSLAALAAANNSYSPYTSDFCGVALQLANGRIYAGRYAENAAYNPSMSPLESALAIMSMNEPAQTPYAIVAAVLVEASAKISQRTATQDVLSSVAPGVQLQYVVAS
jgi:cytidine deaminase